ncbi:DoxX family protein [Olivibacter domesticus]|uniref:Putative oxidoreductase n=1 Tax=Olivibacter domesticus TaxID=407022 RepID=A0A1H7R4A0_OLID1|nr:DoxX family protein [Olivibacter domesticus]SEL54808.1 putative oxidoreductase [Olivibacter domesticus]
MYREIINQMVATNDSWTGLVLRLTLGGVLFPHAVQKLFGWCNGPGLSGEMHFMTQIAGLSSFTAITAIVIECGGMFLLLTGAGTRIAAVGIFGLFIGMIVFIHRPNGFFMNWFGRLPAGMEGFEYHLLVLGLCMAIFIEGGGKFSVDRLYFE